jgi:hypothetical protein
MLVAMIGALGACGQARRSHVSQPTTATSTRPTRTVTAGAQSPKSGPLSRQELIAKADLICRRVNAKRARTKYASAADYARLVPALAEYQQAAVAAMRELVAPASMRSSWNQMVSDAQQFADSVVKFGEYAKANKLREVTSVSIAGMKANERLMALAKRKGFVDCAGIHS